MSNPLSRRALLASLAVTATAAMIHPKPARADCALPLWRVRVLTPLSAPLPLGTAIVIGLESTYAADGVQNGDVRLIHAQLRKGPRAVSLSVDLIAPGLARLVPSSPLAPGSYTLEVGALPPTPVTFAAIPLPAPPPPPTFRTPVVSLTRRRYGESSTALAIELTAPPSSSWVAVVGGWAVAVRRLPTPLSFGAITAGSNRVAVLSPAPSCGTYLPGQSAPTDGMMAYFMFVDQYGQRSAPSSFATLHVPAP